MVAEDYARARAGDFRGMGSTLGALAKATDGVSRAWLSALRACTWLAFPNHVPAPNAQELRAIWYADDEEEKRTALVVLGPLALVSLVQLDVEALREGIETLQPSLATVADPELRISFDVASGWLRLLSGSAPALGELVKSSGAASAAGLAGELVELQVQRALALAELGERASALEAARRASMMARTEALPQQEYLAHWALARVRRLNRQPHLTLRIVESLTPVATSPWRPLLEWEALLAGGKRTIRESSTPRVMAWVERLDALLDSAESGDREAFSGHTAALLGSTSQVPMIGREIADLVGALDPRRESTSSELSAWRSGDTAFLPAGLDGLSSSDRRGADARAVSALVLVRAQAPPARVLGIGAALLDERGLVRFEPGPRKEGRVDTLLAVVALASAGGVDEAIAFELTYDFAYIPEIHRGVFDVLLHRARAHLGASADLLREAGRLRLRPAVPLLLPDPRCSPHTTDRVLRLLAERGRAGAKDAASASGISLRSAQGALQELVSQGACNVEKRGRRVVYVVEDSVFSEPSMRLTLEEF